MFLLCLNCDLQLQAIFDDCQTSHARAEREDESICIQRWIWLQDLARRCYSLMETICAVITPILPLER